MVRFLTFYVKTSPLEREELQRAHEALEKCEYLFAEEPDKTITMLFASVKRFHKEAKLTLLTDQKSAFHLHPSIEIRRYKRKSSELDIEMLYALIDYLKSLKGKEEVIYLEWDQIVQAPLTDIFKGKSDLFFTMRRIHPTPIDDAFIAIASGDNFMEKIEFFEMVIEQYDKLRLKEFRYWLGKALILSLMIFDPIAKFNTRAIPVAALRYKNLAIETLNGKIYSRKPIESEIAEGVPSAKALHFTNSMRDKMAEYWQRHLPKKQ